MQALQQAQQQGLQALQQAQQQGFQALHHAIERSTNSSAIAGAHNIIALNDVAGQSPATAGVWFPDTRSELMNATAAQENALVVFYGLNLLPQIPGEAVGLRRRRTLYRHLGVRA